MLFRTCEPTKIGYFSLAYMVFVVIDLYILIKHSWFPVVQGFIIKHWMHSETAGTIQFLKKKKTLWNAHGKTWISVDL